MSQRFAFGKVCMLAATTLVECESAEALRESLLFHRVRGGDVHSPGGIDNHEFAPPK
jgi:hypothetical protein